MPAEKAHVNSESNIIWEDTTLFNGYMTFSLIINEGGGAPKASYVTLKDSFPAIRVPRIIKIVIREGVLDTENYIWRTNSLVPPNLRYLKDFYDSNNHLIYSDPFVISVTQSTYTVPFLILDIPTGYYT